MAHHKNTCRQHLYASAQPGMRRQGAAVFRQRQHCAANPKPISGNAAWRPTTNFLFNGFIFPYIGMMNLDTLLAQRIRTLRKQRAYALDTLAELSGVSRSMISLIERAETSATAMVLNKLADALGVSLASLFAEETAEQAASPLARHGTQPVWQDPGSGYLRRQLSPPGFATPIELAEVTFLPGQSVTFDNALRSIVTYQQIWLLSGEMHITAAGQCWQLQAGDCLAITLGQQIVFHNPAANPARYLVALCAQPSAIGKPS